MSDGGPSGPPSLPAYYSFDRAATEYEATRHLPPVVASATTAVIWRGLKPEGWLLDAGTGTGRLGREMSRHHGCRRTVGIDVSTAMMREMRRIGAQSREHAGAI